MKLQLEYLLVVVVVLLLFIALYHTQIFYYHQDVESKIPRRISIGTNRTEIQKLMSEIESKNTEIELLRIGQRTYSSSVPPTELSEFCEARYGMTLVDKWRARREIWCQCKASDPLPSEMICYPYHQEHKQLDGRGPDLFCEARNFFVDFSKV